jgi:hypothetical protein
MANHDIQNSQHLLKRLEEEMIFLNGLMNQAQVVAANLKTTWTAIRVTHENWKRKTEES